MGHMVVTVGRLTKAIPDDVDRVSQLLDETGYDPDKYLLFRETDAKLYDSPDELTGQIDVEDGDRFVAIPKYVGDA